MILSHAHRFIYIKTYKTASTSIEIALSRICGPDDVITPARPDLQALREDPQARNYRLDHPLVPKRPLLKRLLRRPERLYHPSVGFYEHMPAWRVRAYVGEQVWNDYFKFTFERNPWDRQVSWYHYKAVRRNKGLSFEQFLADRRRAYVENYDLYSQDGTPIVNFVGRYEFLVDDFRNVAERLGLLGQIMLPYANKSERDQEYRSFYTPPTKALVEGWYQREIRLLDYAF